jgi:hypothetical protein
VHVFEAGQCTFQLANAHAIIHTWTNGYFEHYGTELLSAIRLLQKPKVSVSAYKDEILDLLKKE